MDFTTKIRTTTTCLWLLLLSTFASAQYTVSGTVLLMPEETPAPMAQIQVAHTNVVAESSLEGKFSLQFDFQGEYVIYVYYAGYKAFSDTIDVQADIGNYTIQLTPLVEQLNTVTVEAEKPNNFGKLHLRSVDLEGTAIYASKKSEVVVLEDTPANLATNNSREVYSKVVGLNIWESDGAGIQLGIGGRGLSPNRTSNFNTRQNGYDISADALGYPESYYSPPSQALEQIEVVRGAASLQYGTQFGGFLNFKFRRPEPNQKFTLHTEETLGSYGFFNTFTEVLGTKNKSEYYGFIQYKRGDGWRENSPFEATTGHLHYKYHLTSNLSVTLEYTYMDYLAQQAGGLTDQQFEEDPQQSSRDRNWFQVKWNLPAAIIDYQINDHLKFNNRTFGLVASREALGYQGAINRPDPGLEREYLVDQFNNFGNETRLMYSYTMFELPATTLIGARYYQGKTNRRQGIGSDGSGPDFGFIPEDQNREDLDPTKNQFLTQPSEYDFPSRNVALFAEQIIPISEKISITPGLRWEYIETVADGYYTYISTNLAGEIIAQDEIYEYKENKRNFLLAGVGASYKSNDQLEVYGNISQNYRAINFNDMRTSNPNLVVDTNLTDEYGYSADLGTRGFLGDYLQYDASLFYIMYHGKISAVMQKDGTRLRTNAPDSRNYGIETFVQWDFMKQLFHDSLKYDLSIFVNASYTNAYYINTDDPLYEGHEVEMVPPIILRTGLQFRKQRLRASILYSYTQEHYTDATNTEYHPNAIHGLIPSYYVMDLNLGYDLNRWSFNGSINNLTNNMYYTRRADGYPGPGIIPSDGISFFLSVGVTI